MDLGSGGGKVPYIVSQIVGETGKVIGVDMNDGMLNLARKYQNQMIEKIGYDNVSFYKGKIQNLKLDLEELDKYLQDHPARDLDTYQSIY
ncbi:methyltransferase [Staphylococcus aureus]|uniref:Arsenite methyltransferase n=1 Tax=Staphylococcus aureus TaxID=1280 RepID=A0A380DXB6_STAAU|nr:methyltransferase [Staphylococcus aureus]